MQIAVYLALCGTLALCVLARPVARTVSPPVAAGTLVTSAMLAALAWVWNLGLLAGTLVGQLDVVSDVGHWSRQALAVYNPVPTAVAAVAAGLVAVAAGAFAVRLRRLGRELWRLSAVTRHWPKPTDDGVLVIDDAAPRALAMPGRHGRIVITTAMVRALGAEERRVLLAHERAHLRGRHGLFRAAVRLAAAALPMLRPLIGECDYQLERWADETAAREVGDRHLAARALGRAALARSRGGAAPAAGLCFSERSVAARVRALLAQPPKSRIGRLAGPLALIAATAVLSIDASGDLEDLFELAQRVWGH